MRRFSLTVYLQMTCLAVLTCILGFSRSGVSSDKPRMMVLPLSGSFQLKTGDADYLFDSMIESASLRVAGHLALINKQSVRQAIRTQSGQCDEGCGLAAAKKTGAGVLLICELNMYKESTVGFVKLLDAREETVLSAKRFIVQGEDLRQIEAGMHAAVRYVLSAQFLPLTPSQRAALASRQGEMPPAQYTARDEDPIRVGATPAPSPAAAASPPRVRAPREPRPPSEPRYRKKGYLIAGSVLAPLGVGLSLGGMGFLLRSKKEKDVFQSWDQERVNLVARYEAGQITFEMYEPLWYEYSDMMNQSRAAMRSNNIGGAVFLGIGGVTLVTAIVFFSQYAKLPNAPSYVAVNRNPRLTLTPVLSRDLNGAFLSTSF